MARLKARKKRLLAKPKPKLYDIPWNKRTPSQKLRYRKALSVLTSLRTTNKSYSAACKEQGLGRRTARRYLGKTVFKRKGRIKARKSDSLLRNMQIYSEGKVLYVELNSSVEATRVSHYNQAVKDYLYDGATEKLTSFKGMGITDSKGVFLAFEIDAKKLQEIFERKESFESYEIYER